YIGGQDGGQFAGRVHAPSRSAWGDGSAYHTLSWVDRPWHSGVRLPGWCRPGFCCGAVGPVVAHNGPSPRGRACPLCPVFQTSTCSAIERASSTSMPRYRTVLSTRL